MRPSPSTSPSFPKSECRMLWLATQLIDYAFGLAMVYSVTIYSMETYPPSDHPLRWAIVLFIQGHVAPGLILSERTGPLRAFGQQSVEVQKAGSNQGELEVDSPNDGVFTGLVLHPWIAGHVRLQGHI
ncbi:hypothetical protein THAOC_13050 [Thalassiosira oceanica]|uniref:Uncharacterized protein n=1 Tax=Thalassiosira oceanica TaxID=159749 RepID=K0SIK1_THAOC|nr:hypothetical protein THAOC_13050 [Thalassiosira oceanica]|eukprot:EJK66043.1 hypothetical protein THAOC_13050 [Thalassiosira oceanica]